MNWFRLKSCIKCQGDLAADHGDWLCLQCGTYYYTGLYQLHSHIDDRPQIPDASDSGQPRKKLLGVVTAPLSPALGSVDRIPPNPFSINGSAIGSAMAEAAAL